MQSILLCPICKSTSVHEDYVGHTTRDSKDPNLWHVYRCRTCDHGYLNPQPQWNELDAYYNENYAPYDVDHGIGDEWQKTVKAAKALGEYRHVKIREGQRILDVGCGGGSFIKVCDALGAIACGVEPSAIAAARAKSIGLNVFHGTLEDYSASLPHQRFDLITFSHVVEHLPTPIETLRLASQLLTENGILWLSVPNAGCSSSRILKWQWHSADLPVHLQHFTPSSIRALCASAGLQLKSVSTYSLPTAVNASIIAELRHRWRIPGRIAKYLVNDRMVIERAGRMDSFCSGEAILAEFAS